MKPRAALRLARDVAGCLITGRPKPLAAFLYLSFRCNLGCTYCNLPHLAGEELSTDQWLAIIDQLARLGCRRINFIGGEPLLHPGLDRLLGRAAEHGIARIVSSNGLAVPDKLDTLRLASSLCLSLDGADRQSNLARGAQVWPAVQEAVRAASDISLPFKVNAVVSSQSIAGLPRLIDLVTRQWKAGLTISAARSGNPTLWKDAAKVRLDDQRMRDLFRELAELAGHNPRLLLSQQTYRFCAMWPDYARDFLEEAAPGLVKAGPACQAGRYYLSILPDGRAAPCSIRFDHTTAGNAAKDGVAAVWRELQGHQCLVCYSPCLVELNHLFSFRPGVLASFARRHVPRLS